MKKIHGIALLLALLSPPAFALDEEPPPSRGVAALAARPLPPSARALTDGDVAAFMDGMIPMGIAQADIAGAVVIVVKDGHVLLERGYGYADYNARTPVDPQRTLFRPGSVSKLFTWTAVMQLVEQGRLNLDRDVNDYLDFRIPEAFGKPITLRDLMTHTPGFEEEIKDLGTNDPSRLMRLRSAVVGRTPERIYPPGEVSAYSNYGASLAGYIVERVSGERFEDYIARHIFAPLRMKHATFVQPLPVALAGDMSKGYRLPEDGAGQFELISMSPAGGLSAAGADIARFMMAHLNNGSYEGGTILKPETAVLMHRAAFQPTPPLPAMALGFYHEDRNGHDIIGHEGDTPLFHSDLHLILDANVGLFISLNSAGRETSPIKNLRSLMFAQFMDRYFPGQAPAPPVQLPSARADGEKLAGYYTLSRRSQTNFMSVSALGLPIQIRVAADGSLDIPALAALGAPRRWIEVAPFSWCDPHAEHRLVARVENGELKWVSMDLFPPIMVLQPISFWQSPFFVGPLLAVSALMVLLTTLFWPIKAVLRWRYAQAFPFAGRAATLYRLARAAALVDVVAIVGWAIFLLMGQLSVTFFSSANDGLLRLLQFLALLAIAGAIFPILELVEAIRDSRRPWWTKVTDALLAISVVAIAWFFIDFHFLTWSLNY